MLRVTPNAPNATSAVTREFNTAYEASHHIFELAVAGGCQVEDTLSGRIFEVTHIADRYPRAETPQPVDTPADVTQEVRAA
jgi:hypothetical protein